MITVPVLIGFDNTKQIGVMTLDEKALPSEHANYVFSLGYLAESVETITPVKFFGEYKLMCVSLQTDEEYLGYLQQEQLPVSVTVAPGTPNALDGVRLPDGNPND